MENLRIAFILHSSGTNGATILALHFLSWIRKNKAAKVDVYSLSDGKLKSAFKAVGRYRRVPGISRLSQLVPRRWATAFSSGIESLILRALLFGRYYDVAYFNTATSSRLIPIWPQKSTKKILHIHELEYAIQECCSANSSYSFFKDADIIVAASTAVKQNLEANHKIRDSVIHLVHAFSGVRSQPHVAPAPKLVGYSTIGGCGTLGWRKGTDMFIQLAIIARKRKLNNLRFQWMGGQADDKEVQQFLLDVKNAGISEICSWTPSRNDVGDFYASIDVFALTSREDPFPLVMLEAAIYQKPIVAFQGSGGAPELLGMCGDDGVPYGDVEAFFEKILFHISGVNQSQGFASKLKSVVETNFVAEVQSPKLFDIIRALASSADR